jgi:hypothetical protein
MESEEDEDMNVGYQQLIRAPRMIEFEEIDQIDNEE